jgi:glucose-1-phosphate adenylyltransferase
VRNAIIDKGVRIPAGVEIGLDIDRDRQSGFAISDEGIVVISRTDNVEEMVNNTRAA